MSELADLARDLDNAGNISAEQTRDVVDDIATKVEQTARKTMTGRGHLPHYPKSITHDTYLIPTATIADIGPDKSKRQGSLGHILEYGSPTSPPIPHMGPALNAHTNDFEQAVERLSEGLL